MGSTSHVDGEAHGSDAVGYANRYDPDEHFDHWYTDATAQQLVQHINPGEQVLELGSATGRMTEWMCASGASVLGIEHSAEFLARAQARELALASFELGDFTNWVEKSQEQMASQFDHVVLTNVVHEIDNLPALLDGCHELLRPEGKLHLSLQNPQSVHRLTGQSLGLIQDLSEVTDEGRDLLTKRISDADELASVIAACGFVMIARQGVMLKPFPNSEMAQLERHQIEGLIAVGPSFPDHCAMNYLIARRQDE